MERQSWSHFQKCSQRMNFKKIPMASKAGENYFWHFSQQLKAKGGVAFQAIRDRLVLKDKAFAKGAECMLKDKKLKAKQKEVAEI